VEVGHGPSGKFSRKTKSAAFLAEALKSPLRCALCDGLIHTNSISVDHIQARRDGGLAIINNAQLTHPYCNSIKEKAA
jgi:5-methylcytosine-specific restriction endonuclease McrA